MMRHVWLPVAVLLASDSLGQQSDSVASPAQMIHLTCMVTRPDGSQTEPVLEVDLKNKLINGINAMITDGQFDWTVGSSQWTVNRYTGGLHIFNVGGVHNLSLSGECRPVSQKKF